MYQLTDSTTAANFYRLYLRMASDGFSLSVFDQANTLLSAKKVSAALYSLSLEELITLIETETTLNYQHIYIIVESELYTIIPDAIFRIDEATDFLQLEHKPTKTDSILFNKIPSMGIVNVFAIPGTLHNALTHLFPGEVIEHQISWFIADKVKIRNESCVYAWVRNKTFDVVAVKDGNLQLINSFSYLTPEDFSYFTLNIFDKLSLDIQECPVYLFNAGNKPELAKTLEKYALVKSK